MKHAIVLLNGKAGNNYGRRNAYRIIEQINKEGYETFVVPVGPGIDNDVEEILEHYKDWYDLCVTVGGDGSLHHTINAQLKNGIEKPIAYLPCGTTNDFATSLGITLESPEGSDIIKEDSITLDVGLFNKEYFTYVAAFGALTEVSYSTNQDVKNVLGYTAYALNSLAAIPNGLSARIRASVESEEFSGEGEYMYGSVSNCYSVAGIQSPLLDTVELDDGYFEVVLIKAPDNIAELIEIASTLVSGDIESKNNKHVTMFKTKKVTFTFKDKTEWTLDGEYGGMVTKATVSVKNKKLTLRR